MRTEYFFLLLSTITFFTGCSEEDKNLVPVFSLLNEIDYGDTKKERKKTVIYAIVGSLVNFPDTLLQRQIDEIICELSREEAFGNYSHFKVEFLHYSDSLAHQKDKALIASNAPLNHRRINFGDIEIPKYLAESLWKNGIFFSKHEYSARSDMTKNEWYSWEYNCTN